MADITPKVARMIDANINRCKEGLRVVEDIYRFVYDDKDTAATLKELRHEATAKQYLEFLPYRDIIGDVGKATTESEQNRTDLNALVISNLKRAQESARVLEESFKLIDTIQSQTYKTLRYKLYDIELLQSK